MVETEPVRTVACTDIIGRSPAPIVLPRNWRNLVSGILLGLRLVLGVVFIYSGLIKWRQPFQFLESVYGFELVGPTLGIWVAVVLPFLEVVIGISLVANIVLEAGMLSAVICGSVFVIAQIYAMLNGLTIDCGCFGSSPARPHQVDYTTLIRAGLVLGGAVSGLACILINRCDKLFTRTRSA